MTQAKQPKPRASLLHQALSLLGVAAIILLLPGIVTYDYILSAQTVAISVERNVASKYCRNAPENPRTSYFTRAAGGRARAVEHPGGVAQGTCGAVLTDIGWFRLPESNNLRHLMDGDRAAMQEALVEGCRFEVTAVGSHRAGAGDLRDGYPVFRIVRIKRALGCRIVEKR